MTVKASGDRYTTARSTRFDGQRTFIPRSSQLTNVEPPVGNWPTCTKSARPTLKTCFLATAGGCLPEIHTSAAAVHAEGLSTYAIAAKFV